MTELLLRRTGPGRRRGCFEFGSTPRKLQDCPAAHQHEAGDDGADAKGQVQDGQQQRLAGKVVARYEQRRADAEQRVDGHRHRRQRQRQLQLQGLCRGRQWARRMCTDMFCGVHAACEVKR